MGYIYVIKNDINKKIYVGQTITTLKNRWSQHLHDYLIYDWHLYKAMRKYGVEHFWIEELEQCDESEIYEREKYWIKYFNSVQEGYNMTIGGEGRTFIDRDLVKEKWQQGLSVKEISIELNCHYTAIIRILKELNMYDTKEIQKRKTLYISHVQTGSKIIQYNEQGEVVNIFNSSKEAQIKTGVTRKGLEDALLYHYGAKGFLWRREGEPAPKPQKIQICKQKEIEQIDLQTGKVINVYSNQKEAATATGADASCICKVCKGKRHKAGGYGWKYKEN